MRVHVLQTFVTHPLVHMYQKKKIALEIASKFSSVNGPLKAVFQSSHEAPRSSLRVHA
jgi:hypothetical protein